MNLTPTRGPGRTRVSRRLEFAISVPEHNWQPVLDAFINHGIKLPAFCTYSDGTSSHLLIIPSHEARVAPLLATLGLRWQSSPVVFVETGDSVGAPLAQLGARLNQAGIEIIYSYASWVANEGLAAVFKTNDDARAARLLNELLVPVRPDVSQSRKVHA